MSSKLVTYLILIITIIGCTPVPTFNNKIELEERINKLEKQVIKSDSIINRLIEALPVGSPLDSVKVSSTFGIRRNPITRRWQNHKGMDLKGNRRDTVYSTADGIITKAGWSGGYGRIIVIDHACGYETTYAHLNRIIVNKGDSVNNNQAIGTVGNSGSSTGSHLHYEITRNKILIDPEGYINFNRN